MPILLNPETLCVHDEGFGDAGDDGAGNICNTGSGVRVYVMSVLVMVAMVVQVAYAVQ